MSRGRSLCLLASMLIGKPGCHSFHLQSHQVVHYRPRSSCMSCMSKAYLKVFLLWSSSFCLCCFTRLVLSSWGRNAATRTGQSETALSHWWGGRKRWLRQTDGFRTTSTIPQHHFLVTHQPAEAGEFHIFSSWGFDGDVLAVPVVLHPVFLLLNLHQHNVAQVFPNPHVVRVHLQFNRWLPW